MAIALHMNMQTNNSAEESKRPEDFSSSSRTQPSHEQTANEAPKPTAKAVRDKILEIVDAHEIVVFVESNSQRCNQVKELFRSEEYKGNFDIKIKNVDRSNAKETFQEELYRLTKQPYSPHVWVNGVCLGGASQTIRAHKCGDLAYYLSP